jgi:hypothetical protein
LYSGNLQNLQGTFHGKRGFLHPLFEDDDGRQSEEEGEDMKYQKGTRLFLGDSLLFFVSDEELLKISPLSSETLKALQKAEFTFQTVTRS